MGIALGLVDKGQPYLKDIQNKWNIKKVNTIHDVLKFVVDIVMNKSILLNGTIIELTKGLRNYSVVSKHINKKWYLYI